MRQLVVASSPKGAEGAAATVEAEPMMALQGRVQHLDVVTAKAAVEQPGVIELASLWVRRRRVAPAMVRREGQR